MAERKRSFVIDALKGILIVLVIIGHFLPGSLQENFARYAIYSFHMPLFFFISGYLLNTQALQFNTWHLTCKRYLKRLTIPWIVAVHVYFFLNLFFNGLSLSLQNFIRSFTYYHLWFVTGYLFCVFITLLFYKVLCKVTNTNQVLKGLLCFGICCAAIAVFVQVNGNDNSSLMGKFFFTQ